MIKFEEVTTNQGVIGIFEYAGDNDPVEALNEAVEKFVRNSKYNEFIDANMDNPWMRIILKK